MPIYKTGKSKDGKAQYRVTYNFTDASGKYRQKSKLVYGSAEAKQAEFELTNKKDNSSALTVGKIYAEYIRTKSTEVRESTLKNIEKNFRIYILPKFESTKIDKLNTRLLQEWKNGIAELDLKIITKKHTYSEFRAFLNYALKMGYISQNPLLLIGGFKEPYFEIEKEKLHYYTPEQFKAFIAQATPKSDTVNDWKYYIFFNIAYYTGMRKGEINALKWSDIDENVIHVRRSVAQKIKGKSIVETPPKNKSSYRDLLIPEKLVSMLNEYKYIQQKINGFTDDFRVCGATSCISDTSISNHNIQYADAAGLPRIRIHDFRHSHASLLVNNGVLIQEVSRRLGHAKVDMTWNTYSHLYPSQEESALRVLESI